MKLVITSWCDQDQEPAIVIRELKTLTVAITGEKKGCWCPAIRATKRVLKGNFISSRWANKGVLEGPMIFGECKDLVS